MINCAEKDAKTFLYVAKILLIAKEREVWSCSLLEQRN